MLFFTSSNARPLNSNVALLMLHVESKIPVDKLDIIRSICKMNSAIAIFASIRDARQHLIQDTLFYKNVFILDKMLVSSSIIHLSILSTAVFKIDQSIRN